jgi:hypothetical protein
LREREGESQQGQRRHRTLLLIDLIRHQIARSTCIAARVVRRRRTRRSESD